MKLPPPLALLTASLLLALTTATAPAQTPSPSPTPQAEPPSASPQAESPSATPQTRKSYQDVPVAEINGRMLHVDLNIPIEKSDQPMPAVIYIHGGGWRKGSYHRMPFTNYNWLPFVTKPYVGISVEYRFAPTPEAPGDIWPAAFQDCLAAVRWVRQNAAKFHIDPDRIVLLGISAGAHLANCVALIGDDPAFRDSRFPDVSAKVRAVVDICGPADLLIGPRPYDYVAIPFLGGTPAEKPDLWKQASPIEHITPQAPPFLIIHGNADKTVPIAESERFLAALQKAGIPAEMIVLDNAIHTLTPSDPTKPVTPSQEEVEKKIAAFLDQITK